LRVQEKKSNNSVNVKNDPDVPAELIEPSETSLGVAKQAARFTPAAAISIFA